MRDLLLIFFLLFFGHLFQLFNLLLELLSSIILKPLLLLLDKFETIVKVIIDDGSRDVEQSKLLDNDEVQVEGLFVLNKLALLFTLLLLAAADRSHCSSFSLSLVLSNLDLAIGQLLVNLLLDSLLSLFSFQLSGDLLAVDDEASTDLQGGQVADEMVATVNLFSIRMRQTFDLFLALLFSLLLHSSVRYNFVFLSLHPVDVIDLLKLDFVVISSLPVSFTLFIFLLVERIELLVACLDLILDLVGLSQGLIFLSSSLLHFLPDNLNLPIQFLFLTLESLDIIPNLVLLSLKVLNLWLNLREAFCLRN